MKRNALKLTCVMRVPYASAMLCMVVKTTAADGRRAKRMRKSLTKLSCVMRMPSANAMFCAERRGR